MSDKMREEFEEWYLNEFFAGSIEACGAWLSRHPGGGYIYALPVNQWKCWKASRSALVVELPRMPKGPYERGDILDYTDDIHEALTKAGVTVK